MDQERVNLLIRDTRRISQGFELFPLLCKPSNWMQELFGRDISPQLFNKCQLQNWLTSWVVPTSDGIQELFGQEFSTQLLNKPQLKNVLLASQVVPTGLKSFHLAAQQTSVEKSTFGKPGDANRAENFPPDSPSNVDWKIDSWQVGWCQTFD